jgi:hypothetical protein
MEASMSADIVRLAERGRPYKPHPVVNPFADAIAGAATLTAALYAIPAMYWSDVANLYRHQVSDDRRDTMPPSDCEPA